mgnify:CR=1 FL=1
MGENHLRIVREKIQKELKVLNKINDDCLGFYREIGDVVNSSINLRVLGSFLHDFYTCVEKIFRIIASDIDGEIPVVPSWHSSLLEQMSLDLKPIRKKVINDDLMALLYEYLRFRHVFRNLYRFELRWDKMEHLVNSLGNTFNKIELQLDHFLAFLDEID